MTVDTAIAVAESCSQLQSTNQNQMKLYDSLFLFLLRLVVKKQIHVAIATAMNLTII